jgi:hypothetical protein
MQKMSTGNKGMGTIKKAIFTPKKLLLTDSLLGVLPPT